MTRTKQWVTLSALVAASTIWSGESVGASAQFDSGVVLPWRQLTIHGPVELQPADLAKLVSSPGNAGSPETTFGNSCVGSCVDPTGFGDGLGDRGPEPTTRWAADGRLKSNAMDVGIAVGKSFILAGSRDHVAMYDKGGNLTGSKYLTPTRQPLDFPNPFTLNSFFGYLTSDLNAALNLPSGLPAGIDISNGYGIDEYFDGRVMYDAYRQRFWIAALARNSKLRTYVETKHCDKDADNDGKCDDDSTFSPADSTDCAALVVNAGDLCGATVLADFPALKTARRSYVVVAVSKTSDPRDGFNLYWWDASINDGTCDTFDGCTDVLKFGFQGGDYPTIGISDKYLLVTAGLSFKDAATDTSSVEKAEAWIECPFPYSACGAQHGYAHMSIVPVDALTPGLRPCNGPPGQPCPSMPAWQFAAYHTPKNKFTDEASQARGMRPVVHHGVVPFGLPMFVNNFIDESKAENDPGRANFVIWAFQPQPQWHPSFFRTTIPVRPFRLETWTVVMNAVFRNQNIYATWHECVQLFTTEPCRYSIRTVRADVLFPDNPQFFDDTFGIFNVFDDPVQIAPVDYLWPGLEVNKDDNVVVVYNRHDPANLPQEARYSVRFDGEQTIRPSNLLKAGELTRGFAGPDTIGTGVDPSDDKTIWMAHSYDDSEVRLRIIVGKVLGPKRPDLAVATVDATAGLGRAGETAISAKSAARNDGDGRSSEAVVDFYVSRDRRIDLSDRLIATTAIPPLDAGGVVPIDVSTVVRNVQPGAYFILSTIRFVDSSIVEYSSDNNVSPVFSDAERVCIAMRPGPTPGTCR